MKEEKRRQCRGCGCTQALACPEGCYWLERDFCSACRNKLEALKSAWEKLPAGLRAEATIGIILNYSKGAKMCHDRADEMDRRPGDFADDGYGPNELQGLAR